ncbi:hypothetical protein EYF80_054067 [Liparis tanakae]|uniref:Uncharacterized protein n=1 Tax=Liparis tanakae TaxID=230148 RepID=A0A4Z2F3Q1_9TELE|nr:hypothetical protein EYF80_054067 [Liparis tanakae]
MERIVEDQNQTGGLQVTVVERRSSAPGRCKEVHAFFTERTTLRPLCWTQEPNTGYTEVTEVSWRASGRLLITAGGPRVASSSQLEGLGSPPHHSWKASGHLITAGGPRPRVASSSQLEGLGSPPHHSWRASGHLLITAGRRTERG